MCSTRWLLLALLAVGSTAQGASSDLLRAVSEAPALAAAARRVEAAEARVGASGQLPDPEVEGMLSQMRGPMGERNNMVEVNVRQPLPKRGERAAQRDLARAGVAMAAADYAAMAGEMAADTAMAVAEAESGAAKIERLEAQIARMESVLRAIEVRLSTGAMGGMGGRLADRLALQTRIAAMQLMIEEERRMNADVLAEARARLGLPSEAALPAYEVLSPAEVSAEQAAAVQLARARAAEADAMGKMAVATARPMTAVGVRFERERTPMGDEDTLGIAFMSEFPWRSRHTSRAQSKAADAERRAAQADASAATHRVASAVARVERAARLAATARKVSTDTRARVEAETDALIRAASAGTPSESTVLMVVELLEKSTDAELQAIDAEKAARVAAAELWRFVPVDRVPVPVR